MAYLTSSSINSGLVNVRRGERDRSRSLVFVGDRERERGRDIRNLRTIDVSQWNKTTFVVSLPTAKLSLQGFAKIIFVRRGPIRIPIVNTPIGNTRRSTSRQLPRLKWSCKDTKASDTLGYNEYGENTPSDGREFGHGE